MIKNYREENTRVPKGTIRRRWGLVHWVTLFPGLTKWPEFMENGWLKLACLGNNLYGTVDQIAVNLKFGNWRVFKLVSA